MRKIVFSFLITVLLNIPLIAQDTFYVEASRNAIVHANHSSDSEVLLRLQTGDQLNAVTGQQTERYYNVYLPDGRTGWVSRYVVRLHEGTAPDAPPVAVMPNVGGGLTTQEREYAAFHLSVGKPLAYKELIRKGFVIGYDPTRKIPLWVQYRLTQARSDSNLVPRPGGEEFDEDVAVHITGRAALDDYSEVSLNYVRGHMAPAEDMRWDDQVALESMLLTNIAPQIGSAFNGSLWLRLENRVRRWVIDRDDLTIICGPVFEARNRVQAIPRQPLTNRQMVYNVVGQNDVAVPTSFFKIIIDYRNPDAPNVLAFLMPHITTTANSDERNIENYLTSVNRIEELTGLDFLTNLSQQLQDNIESQPAPGLW